MDAKQREAVETMSAFIDMLAKAGFETEEEAVASALGYMEGAAEESFLRPHAKQMAREAFARQKEEQPHWPAVTDCDRLDSAFAELDENGIIARQNYWCCQTCGNDAIGTEIDELSEMGRKVRGFAYYHTQDTESAVEGYGVCLCYGSVEESEEERIALANEIVSTIEKHGLKPKWNGDLKRRIEVPLDWKRRREFTPKPTVFGRLRSLFQ